MNVQNYCVNYKGKAVRTPSPLEEILLSDTCGVTHLSAENNNRFRVVYGLQVTDFQSFGLALAEFSNCILHARCEEG